MTNVRAKEAPDFVVDRSKGALINTNKNALQAHKIRKTKEKRLDQLERRVDQMQESLNRIEMILRRLAPMRM
jgi:ribosomal protein L14E/L6E/L27E